MKTILIILGVLALIFVVVLIINPVLMLITSTKGPDVKSKVEIKDEAMVCTLTLENAKSPMFITALDAPRNVAEKIGLGPPKEFTEALLQDQKSDPEWVASWNKENVQFAGKYKLDPNVPTILKFLIKTPPTESFTIMGQFETGRKFGNMLSGFLIKIEK